MQIAKNNKILFVYYKLFKAGGVARVLVSLANELVKNGYEVTILILTSNLDSFYTLDKRVQIISINTFSHWGFTKINVNLDKFGSKIPYKNNIKNYVYDFGQWSMLNKWMNINHQEYDVIISSWYKLSIQLSLNKNVSKKTIAWEHIAHTNGGKLYTYLRKYYKNLDYVICTNTPDYQYFKDQNISVARIYNLMSDKIYQIGVNENILNSKNNTISYIVRLEEQKNVMEFLEIINSIDYKGWEIKIIGDGVYYKKMTEFVENNNLKNILFFGTKDIDFIYSQLLSSKIVCLTSISEALPTILIEGMMTGNTLISYDCNYGPSDIINDKNGFLIPMHNKKMFQEKLQLLIDNNSKLNDLCKSSYGESKKWSKEITLKQWMKILNR